jgi:hypothetical protein
VAAIVLVAKSGAGNAQTNAASAPPTQAAPPPATSTATQAAPPPVAMKSSALAAMPLKATIKRDDQVLKNPAVVEVPEGGTVNLEVSLDGYTTQLVTLAAGDSKSVTLSKAPPAMPTGKLPPGVKPPPTTPTIPVTAPPKPPPKPACDPDDPFCKR